MEKLGIKINKLGAVVNSEVELRPFMIFTGESGLGKSYVAFLSHYVYALLSSGERLSQFFSNQDFTHIIDNAKAGDIIYRIKSSELFDWINKDAVRYIGYMIGHDKFFGDIEISWPYEEESIDFLYDQELAGLDNSEELIYYIKAGGYTYRWLSNNTEIEIGKIFQVLIRAILSTALYGSFSSQNRDYILPPSRGALMELSERQAFRSGMYLEFFKLKDHLSSPLFDAPHTEDETLQNLLQRLNHGQLKQTDNNITYQTSEGIAMPLTAAASSVKELAPFTMLLNKFRMSTCSILLEEPEAHLHPERQNYAADLIGYALRKGCHIQITTHSDYFIKRLNQLCRLGKLYKIKPVETQEILDNLGIDFQSLIDTDQVCAYILVSNADGTSHIKRIDSEDGIAFYSFDDVIDREFDITDAIEELENEGY